MSVVVSIGHFCAICVIFVPQEYFPIIPPHSMYVSYAWVCWLRLFLGWMKVLWPALVQDRLKMTFATNNAKEWKERDEMKESQCPTHLNFTIILQKNFLYTSKTMTSSKRKSVVIGSRLREWNKKNMEYYGGDYSMDSVYCISSV